MATPDWMSFSGRISPSPVFLHPESVWVNIEPHTLCIVHAAASSAFQECASGSSASRLAPFSMLRHPWTTGVHAEVCWGLPFAPPSGLLKEIWELLLLLLSLLLLLEVLALLLWIILDIELITPASGFFCACLTQLHAAKFWIYLILTLLSRIPSSPWISLSLFMHLWLDYVMLLWVN